MSRTIHVTLGDCALAEALSIPTSDVVFLRDDLSCGPLGAPDDLNSWYAMRHEFWDHLEAQPPNSRKRRQPSTRATRDQVFDSLDRLTQAHEVVIWLGTGLAEQLALAWMPQILRAIGGRAESMRIVQFDRMPSGKPIPTVGILSGEELQKHPNPHPIDRIGLAYLDKAWNAASASIPAPLLGFIEQISGPFPLLRAAFEKILWRYPKVRSGINRYEAHLLASARDNGPTAASAIAHSITDVYRNEDDFVGDNWLFRRLRRLADPTLPHPAVTLSGERTSICGTEVHLTRDGEQFLKGQLNFIELNGIDDWVCGVHLDARVGRVWIQENGKIVRG